MNVKIGSIVKRLRTEKGVTQEMLASAVGVTPQAVSRWEGGSGYPDIELLPALADFFSVTTDELIGYNVSERQRKLEEVKKEMDRLAELGTPDECLAFAREAYAKYPSDFEVREYLATQLYIKWDDTKSDERDDTLLTEAEALAFPVVEDCKNFDTRYDAISLLNRIYSATKQPEKALELTSLLVPMKYCREFVMSQGIGDGKTEYYIQNEIDKLTDCLGTAIQNLVLNEDVPNDPSTWDKKLEMLRTANELYRMIYGDDLMFSHCRLSFNYWVISTYQMSQGKTEEALDSLELMAEHAVEYDKSYRNDHGKLYTSIFVDKIEYPFPGKDFHELEELSYSDCMLEKMENSRYDPIRENERFKDVIRRLQEYAGKPEIVC